MLRTSYQDFVLIMRPRALKYSLGKWAFPLSGKLWNINNNMLIIICLKGIFRLQFTHFLASNPTWTTNSTWEWNFNLPQRTKCGGVFCLASEAKKIAFDSDCHSFLQSWHNHMLKIKKMCTFGEQIPRYEPKVKAIK